MKKTYNYSRENLVMFLKATADACEERLDEGHWTINPYLLREAAVKLETPNSEEDNMTNQQKQLAKGIFLGATLHKQSHLTKAYLALGLAAVYGIRAARQANEELDLAVDKLKEERSRPVVAVVEP